jgi:hypothetical protein
VEWKQEHEVSRAGEHLPVDPSLYCALKQSLVEYFIGKCAYCESEFSTVAWGDVEHYRPKRAVSEEPTHPGYYWLSYCEANLLPSCEICNRGKGKRSHFPICGKRAMRPGDDLLAEEPLLLNPYLECDCGGSARHMHYIFEYPDGGLSPTGFVEGLTDAGKKSVEIYGLNRGPLVGRRRKNQEDALIRLERAACISAALLARTIRDLYHNRQEHASAVRATCGEWITLIKGAFDCAQVPSD